MHEHEHSHCTVHTLIDGKIAGNRSAVIHTGETIGMESTTACSTPGNSTSKLRPVYIVTSQSMYYKLHNISAFADAVSDSSPRCLVALSEARSFRSG